MLTSWLLAGILASNTADLMTTQIALQSPRIEEANPLARSTTARFAMKTASTTGQLVIIARLRRTRPRLAMWLGIGVIAINSTIAVHNYALYQHVKENR